MLNRNSDDRLHCPLISDGTFSIDHHQTQYSQQNFWDPSIRLSLFYSRGAKSFFINHCWFFSFTLSAFIKSDFSPLFCEHGKLHWSNFQILNQSYIPGIIPTWSWFSGLIILRHMDLHSWKSVLFFFCKVLIQFCIKVMSTS
jgi:hypothetical protein